MTNRCSRSIRRLERTAPLTLALLGVLSLPGCILDSGPVVHKEVRTLPPVQIAVATPAPAPAPPPSPVAVPSAGKSDSARELRVAEAPSRVARGAASPPFVRDLPTTIYYDNDAYLVAPEFRSMLAQHASNLKADPNLRLQIVGYTDARGPVDYNRALAQMRATTVIKTLAEMGVDRAQLEAQARGIERANPRADPSSEARSRRVELVYLR